MKPRCGNISCARHRNNAAEGPTTCVALPTRARAAGLAIALLAITGCATAPPKAVSVVPIWELTSAEPAPAQSVGRARVPYDRPLPAYLTQRLSSDFTLVSITRQQDWADVCRRLALSPSFEPDLRKGMVAGIIATVGEPARASCWPTEIKTTRERKGLGSIEADFAPGLYYPVRTAGYLDLVYLPGAQAIGMVRVGERTFIIRSAAPVY